MCFIIGELKKANKNIVCYKILIEDSAGILRSPYFLKVWRLGEKYIENLTKKKINISGKIIEYQTSTGFYTYKNIKSSRMALKMFKEKTKENFMIFKCIIPKNSNYYIGDLYTDEFCSKELIIKRKLIFNLI